jgi:flagellar biosynthesis/type III secretory pathway chaperone
VTDVIGNLSAVLQEQIRCAEAMLDVLARENQALRDGDMELLGAAGADKARIVGSLEQLEGERRSLATAIGAATRVAAGHEDARSSPEWQTLLRSVAACKTLNEQNGALLKARSEHVRATLTLLRGAEPDVYAARGTVQATASTRPLGTA